MAETNILLIYFFLKNLCKFSEICRDKLNSFTLAYIGIIMILDARSILLTSKEILHTLVDVVFGCNDLQNFTLK